MSALRPSHHRIVSGPDDNFRLPRPSFSDEPGLVRRPVDGSWRRAAEARAIRSRLFALLKTAAARCPEGFLRRNLRGPGGCANRYRSVTRGSQARVAPG